MLTTLVLRHPCFTRIYLEAGAYFDDGGDAVTHCPGEWLGSVFTSAEQGSLPAASTSLFRRAVAS